MTEQVFAIYSRIILQFLLELYVFYVLVMFRYARAKQFAAKLFGGLAAIAVIALGISFIYYYIGGTDAGRIALYLVLFAITTLHAKLCFSENYKTVLFGCSLAYAAQNLVYKLFLIFYCAGEQYHLFDGWGDNFSLYYRLVYYAFFIAAAAVTYFALIRRILRRLPDCRIDFRMMAISLFVLVITVILCSVEDIHFGNISSDGDNAFESFDVYLLRQTGNIFSVVCCAVVIVLISQTLVERNLQREVEYLQYAVRQGQKQYEISKDTIDLINIKCHDIKYKVNALLAEGNGITSEAVADLTKSISIYDTRVSTGNKILDVLFTEKSLYCEQNGITFSCMADGALLSFMDDGDLYCLFGNMIDNAMEAVSAVPDKERRVINIVVKAKNDMVPVQEDNYFEGELEFRDGLPRTTKSDKKYHGFGTRSMRMIVDKYDGAFAVNADNGVYHLNIIFCSQNRK